MKIEKSLPVFFGILGALVCCAFLAKGLPAWHGRESGDIAGDNSEKKNPAMFFAEKQEEPGELIRELYRDSSTRDFVIDFFAAVCGSREVAKTILSQAEEYQIPPALAFALSWEESRFNPKAVNAHNRDGSIDRGLFQLNNRSFPKLESQDFFSLAVNAKYGMSHLRYCLDTGGTEIAALAMYNAGTGRVRSTGAPKSTLDYIHRILGNRRKIESRFNAHLPGLAEYFAAGDKALIAAEKNARFVPLLPLSQRQ